MQCPSMRMMITTDNQENAPRLGGITIMSVAIRRIQDTDFPETGTVRWAKLRTPVENFARTRALMDAANLGQVERAFLKRLLFDDILPRIPTPDRWFAQALVLPALLVGASLP